MSIYNIQNLTFSYTPTSEIVLRDVNLTISEGEVVSLLGRNGSGKSTLMYCMMRLQKPNSGQILLKGEPLEEYSVKDIAQVVGYVPQHHTPEFSYSVLDFVTMGSAAQMGLFSRPGEKEYEEAHHALELLGIADIAEQPYTDISGGQRQQATIARAIVLNPEIVIFDEPTAHLDFANQLRVLRIIKKLSQEGFAVIFSTHNPDHALLLEGTSAVLNEDGTLDSGPTKEIITQQRLQNLYGEDVRLEYIPALERQACVYPNI